MNKYITPTIEVYEVESTDVITISGNVEYKALEGIDKEDERSAIFDASFWID